MRTVLFLVALIVAQAVAYTTYYIETKTSSESYAGTDAIDANVTLRGKNGSVNLGLLDNVDVDDFVRGATDFFTFTSEVDIGEVALTVIKKYFCVLTKFFSSPKLLILSSVSCLNY